MASDDSDIAAQLVAIQEAAVSNLYWTSCALALLLYDYFLTFRHEVRFVWGRKFSGATVLFLANRYVIVVLYLVDLVTLFPLEPTTCAGTGRFVTVLEVLPYIIWATFSSLRAYALSSRTASIGIVIFVLSLIPGGINAYFFSTFTFENLPPPSNCTALSDITPQLSKTLTIVSRASLMAADLLVIVVTWVSTYRIGKASRDAKLGTSFGTLLLRDGTIYFIVLLAMNIVHMTLNTVKPNNIVQQASYVTVLENPITSILISRFILNLRAVDHRALAASAPSSLYTTSPSFVRTTPGAGMAFARPGDTETALETVTRTGAGAGRRFAGGVVDEFGAPLARDSEYEGGFGAESDLGLGSAEELGEAWGADELEKGAGEKGKEVEVEARLPVSPVD